MSDDETVPDPSKSTIGSTLWRAFPSHLVREAMPALRTRAMRLARLSIEKLRREALALCDVDARQARALIEAEQDFKTLLEIALALTLVTDVRARMRERLC